MLRHLAGRAIDGVEKVDGPEKGAYRRTIEADGWSGWMAVRDEPQRSGLRVEIRPASQAPIEEIVRRVRRLFDLDADWEKMRAHLMKDEALAKVMRERPGLRIPGSWDAFELATRAVLGQQVSLSAARRLAGKLVQICGRRVGDEGWLFPNAGALIEADLSGMGMPQARKRTLQALAEAVISSPELLGPAGSLKNAVVRLRSVTGIGEWTAQYIALRALGERDAFPASDVGILRGAAQMEGRVLTAKQMLARAEAWRPWRGYAAQHLWTLAGEVRTSAGRTIAMA